MKDDDLVTKVQNAVIYKYLSMGFDKLTGIEKIVLYVSSLDFEITMSDLYTYYNNSSGEYAVDVVGALEAIGAFEAAQIIKKANFIFPKGTPSRNRKTRIDELRRLGKKGESILDNLTDEFYKKVELFPFIDRFILEHKQEFSELDLSGADKLIEQKKFSRSGLSYDDISDKIHKGVYITQLQDLIGEDVPIVGLTTRDSNTISFTMPLKDVDVRLVTDKNERVISWEAKPKNKSERI